MNASRNGWPRWARISSASAPDENHQRRMNSSRVTALVLMSALGSSFQIRTTVRRLTGEQRERFPDTRLLYVIRYQITVFAVRLFLE